ncbi:MAG: SDR family NAD(P)-dependent oxidoreductase [Spirochaetota bacterium]
MNFHEKTVVITGATSGIGRAYARYFAERGARLLVTGRRGDLLAERRNELLDRGATRVDLVVGDLADESTVERLLDAVCAGPVCVLVNNAGFGHYAPVAAADIELLRAMLRVHAEVPLRLVHAVLAGMTSRREGVVINVGSLAGRVAVPGSALYVATKVYLERLSESIALEAAQHGVVVQALTPGYVLTDFHRDDTEDTQRRGRNRGLIRWMNADSVVARSMRAVRRAEHRIAGRPRRLPRRRDVVVVPGLANRFLERLSRFLPRTLVYRAAARAATRARR